MEQVFQNTSAAVGNLSGAGGGEVRLEFLDDIDVSGRGHKSILMYNEVTSKYEVADPDLDAGISNEDDSGDEIILNATTSGGADESGSIQQENNTRMAASPNTTVSSFSLSTPTLTLTDSESDTVTVNLSGLIPDTATALATGRTIAMTGDVTWTSASFDGSGNVTGTAAIGSGVILNADINASAAIAWSKLATDSLDATVSKINLKDYGEVTNAIGATGGGTQDIDLTAGNSVSATVDSSTNTFTFSDPTASDELCGFTLTLVNGGSQTVNWPGSVDWAGGTAPTLTTSGTDILTFFTIDAGTIWHGAIAIADSK